MRHPRPRFTMALLALLTVLGIVPKEVNAQPIVNNQVRLPDRFPVCTSSPADHVVIVIGQTAWQAAKQLNHLPARGVPTQWLANQPAPPWRPTSAGVDTTTERYRGFELTVRELVDQIPQPGLGWTSSFLNISSPSQGLWLQDRDMLTTWDWTSNTSVELASIYHRYGAPVESNFIITGSLANARGEFFDESVGFVCVTANQFVTQPSQWGSDGNYYQRVQSGSSDLVIYRDWCGRWTCLNRPRD